MEELQRQANYRMQRAFRPRTTAAYLASFRQFVAFLVIAGLSTPYHEAVIVVYIEYLIQQGLKGCSIRNSLSVLRHYFAMFGWPVRALTGRKVNLLIKSVQINAKISIKVKGIITIPLLRKIIGFVFAALFATAFLGFFRLSTLLPPKVSEFEKTRFPIQNDIVWGAPGVHITCSKTMQASNQAKVVQLPNLKGHNFCPVQALKTWLARTPRDNSLPLFQIHTRLCWVPLVAPKAHSFLRSVVISLGLNPSSYTFHVFRRSGASLAFDNNVELSKIKQHGNWKSEAIWTYLNSTPVAASIVPSTFKQLLATSN